MDVPAGDRRWRETNYVPHPLGYRIELIKSQHAVNIISKNVFFCVDIDQTVAFVSQTAAVKIAVERDKGGTT